MGQQKKQKRDAHPVAPSQEKVTGEVLCRLSEEDIRPTEREKQLLQDLFDWQERSRKTPWVLGQPLGVRP